MVSQVFSTHLGPLKASLRCLRKHLTAHLELTRYSIFFPVYFLFLWLFVHPDYLYYAIVNTRDEPFPIFLTGKAFFLSECGRAGGMSDYVSALLSQSYAFSWLGSAATTLLSVGIYLFLRRTTRLKKSLFIFLSPLVSLCMIIRYEHTVPLLTNSLIVLVWIQLYDICASRFRTLRYWLLPLFFAGVFFMSGRGVVVFFIVMAIRILWADGPESGKKSSPRILTLLLTALVFSMMLYFFAAVFGASGGPMPIYYSFSTGRLHVYWFDCVFLASIALCCMLPMVYARLSITVAPYRRYRFVAGAAVAVLCLYFSHSRWIGNHMRFEYLTHKNQWKDVLTFAGKLHSGDLDVITMFDVNSALYHTGKLASDMFFYPQSIPALILPVAFEKSPVTVGLRSAQFYFELGEVNMAQQKLYEIYETSSEHPLVLRGIAETHLVKNQIAAARLVYARLGKDLVYGEHARTMLSTLEKDSGCDVGDRLKNIRRFCPDNDSVRKSVDVAAICQELLGHDSHNRMAFEYLMALYLLAGDLESFSSTIDRAKDFGYTVLPRPWSEAVALYVDLIKSNDRHLRALAGEAAIGQAAHFKESFIGANKQWDLRKLREYCDDFQEHARLRPEFGTTYFYYFFFQQSGMAG